MIKRDDCPFCLKDSLLGTKLCNQIHEVTETYTSDTATSTDPINPENKCAHLYNQPVDLDKITIEEMFRLQLGLQKHVLRTKGRGMDYVDADFETRVADLTVQWRNMTTEFTELLERLPFKEWKNYTREQKSGFTSEEHRLEVLYEYIDMFHFFMNMGLALGVDGETFKKLYATKNRENIERQNRGY